MSKENETELHLANPELMNAFIDSMDVRDNDKDLILDIHVLEKARHESHFQSRLLQAVNTVATMLIAATPDTIDIAVLQSLKTLGSAAEADRAYVWEVFEHDGRPFSRQLYEWSETAEPQQGKDFTDSLDFDDAPFWKSCILSNKIFNGPVKSIPEGADRQIVEDQDIKSMILIPIQVKERIWGYIGFDDCKMERVFSQPEEQVLLSGGVLMVTAIIANSTAQLLQIQNKLRRAVNQISLTLSESKQENFHHTIRQTLKIYGECTGAAVVSIWRCGTDKEQKLIATPYSVYSFVEDTDVTEGGFVLDVCKYLPEWASEPRSDINTTEFGLNQELRVLRIMRYCKSLLLMPISVQGTFWGFIAFEHNDSGYLYSDAERDILRTGGMLIASSVIREEINENLIEARKNAEAGARAKSDFLSRMSHEIRTPINAIIGMTELSRNNTDPQKAHHYIDVIDTSSRQLLGIINDVLDMSKIDANKLEIANSEFDFADMLHHVVNVIQVKLDEKKLVFKLDFPHTFTRAVISDRLRLSQVLINLLSNAVKFTPEKGTIILKIRETLVNNNRSHLRLEVEDSGVGIAPEYLETVFQAFIQVDGGNTRQYGGAGLGLAICRQLITLMGGKIWAESDLGSGARFIAELDVEWGQTIKHEADTAKKSNSTEYDWSDKTILLADDVDINREIVAGMLEDTRIVIEYAENGQHAVEMYKAASEKYSLIFMDVQMPVLDGYAATSQIRASGLRGAETIPIIAMTANAFKEDVQASLDAGMNGHIAKPISVQEIFSVMKNTFDKSWTS